jgi:outer membrane protein OmpA-like peptidoglycan-associated protein
MKKLNLLYLLLICFGLVGSIWAQAPLQNASSEELVEKLNPVQQKTRSLSRNLVPEVPNLAEKPSVDLVIQFEFGSAKLIDQSKILLENLANAMQGDVLTKYSFNVEGHTDSVGSQAYNLKLSKERAQAVVNYLVSRGVGKERLVGVGKGSTQLLLVDRPDAPENRRVRIVVNT